MRSTFCSTISLVMLAALAACSDGPSTAPTALAAAARADATPAGAGPARVTVMTRNMYIGADVDPLIGALLSPDPTDDVPALLAAITTLQETSFPARVEAMADEIARQRPDVVGLQEVDDLTIDLRAMGLPVNIEYHFLQSLLDALAARGLSYQLAGQRLSVSAAPVPGIMLADHDAIIVNTATVTVDPSPLITTYQYNVGELAPGIYFTRGAVVIGATVGGRHVTIANTHFQTGDGAPLVALRAGQATELAATLAGASPAIVLGDFNDIPTSPAHEVMTGAGFTDAWSAIHPKDAGLTCCELPDLSNPRNTFDQRIDYVWTRGLGEEGGDDLGRILLVGDKRADKIAGPAFAIWPSDHAAVVATLRFTPSGDVARSRR